MSTRMKSPANKMLTNCVVILKMKTLQKIEFINNSNFFLELCMSVPHAFLISKDDSKEFQIWKLSYRWL